MGERGNQTAVQPLKCFWEPFWLLKKGKIRKMKLKSEKKRGMQKNVTGNSISFSEFCPRMLFVSFSEFYFREALHAVCLCLYVYWWLTLFHYCFFLFPIPAYTIVVYVCYENSIKHSCGIVFLYVAYLSNEITQFVSAHVAAMNGPHCDWRYSLLQMNLLANAQKIDVLTP